MGSGLILKPGSQTTIQDFGRVGSAFYAIPRSGVMDQLTASMANNLIGNTPNAPVLECTLRGPTIEFESPVTIAITGADMHWKINGEKIPLNSKHNLKTGDILSSAYARDQLRSYVAIRGQIETTYHFGSCSSYASAGLGHNQGKAFAKGDYLKWSEVIDNGLPNTILSETNPPEVIAINKGPEYNYLTAESQNILTQKEFKLGPNSNRMGARLLGEKLSLHNILNESVPVLPGFIQLPPSGYPIVVLQEGQTTGGYPRIAYLNSKDLYSFNRLPIGQPFSFNLFE